MKIRTLTLLSALTLTLLIPLSGAAQAVRDHPDGHETTLPPPSAGVHIDFVYYNPPGPDWPHAAWRLNREYVVVRNASWRTVDLEDWTLENSDDDDYTFDHVWLRPGRSVVVHTGWGRDHWGSGRRYHVYWGQHDYMWDDSRDTATLKDDDGDEVDTCSWWRPWPGFTSC
jgi:hypothetical protein